MLKILKYLQQHLTADVELVQYHFRQQVLQVPSLTGMTFPQEALQLEPDHPGQHLYLVQQQPITLQLKFLEPIPEILRLERVQHLTAATVIQQLSEITGVKAGSNM
ncbi:hypothetical protein SDC9_64034 [bioreactor metagenome]|uniref:Uncharacterized protein n=1 Tax=bioreactor metagenome TaxID=1076179 RepID=A0A644XNS9_9ZZZZ